MEKKRGRGHPKRWENENDFLNDWEKYCLYIMENDFCVVPNLQWDCVTERGCRIDGKRGIRTALPHERKH